MGLLAPLGLLPVHRKWMRFAEVVGNFNAKVILILTYFLVFTPIRIVASVFREDPLSRKFEPGKKNLLARLQTSRNRTQNVMRNSFNAYFSFLFRDITRLNGT